MSIFFKIFILSFLIGNGVVTAFNKASAQTQSDTTFVLLSSYANGFVYDMRYATSKNFLKKAVYPCASCMIRKQVADALIKANADLKEKGLTIKFYDCYRPVDVQKKMWEIYPNAQYVANPYKSGSMHNRGGAVDITLVDSKGKELDMGTGFDYFGEEAHHDYTNLKPEVLANRKALKEAMEANGFRAIRTEWWHYSFKGSEPFSLSNFQLKCD